MAGAMRSCCLLKSSITVRLNKDWFFNIATHNGTCNVPSRNFDLRAPFEMLGYLRRDGIDRKLKSQIEQRGIAAAWHQ